MKADEEQLKTDKRDALGLANILYMQLALGARWLKRRSWYGLPYHRPKPQRNCVA